MNLNSVAYQDIIFLHMSYFSGLASQLPYHSSAVSQVGTKTNNDHSLVDNFVVACEQALLFRQAKRVSREACSQATLW